METSILIRFRKFGILKKMDLNKYFSKNDSNRSSSGKSKMITGSLHGFGGMLILTLYLHVKSRFVCIFMVSVVTCKRQNSSHRPTKLLRLGEPPGRNWERPAEQIAVTGRL